MASQPLPEPFFKCLSRLAGNWAFHLQSAIPAHSQPVKTNKRGKILLTNFDLSLKRVWVKANFLEKSILNFPLKLASFHKRKHIAIFLMQLCIAKELVTFRMPPINSTTSNVYAKHNPETI
jgi:hypothetical protein